VPASTAKHEQKIEPQPQEVAQTQQQPVQHAAAPANRQERFFE
jgi:hypothetical protein